MLRKFTLGLLMLLALMLTACGGGATSQQAVESGGLPEITVYRSPT